MKKLIFIALLLFALGCDSKKETIEYPPTTNSFILPQQIWDFGAVPKDCIVTHHFPIINPHPDTITIVDFDADCDCTKLPETPIIILPGETKLIKISFDSKTYYGTTNREIGLMTDYPTDSLQSIYFTSVASQLPVTIRISPVSVAFIPGKEVQIITIENLVVTDSECRLRIDNDEILTVSQERFTLGRYEKIEIEVRPVKDKISDQPIYSSLTLEVQREDLFRVSIPIKIVSY